jgi:uncharacterized protein (TIGR02646 family)
MLQITKNELREFILNNEQEYMCAYCEKKISSSSEKSNTDHFKTRHMYPELTLDYKNLFVSCKSQEHCEYIKDNKGLIKEDFDRLISPLMNMHDNFTYSLTGDILGLNKNAEYTINTFILNHISLKEERLRIIKDFEYYKELDENILITTIASHQNLISYLKAQ